MCWATCSMRMTEHSGVSFREALSSMLAASLALGGYHDSSRSDARSAARVARRRARQADGGRLDDDKDGDDKPAPAKTQREAVNLEGQGGMTEAGCDFVGGPFWSQCSECML